MIETGRNDPGGTGTRFELWPDGEFYLRLSYRRLAKAPMAVGNRSHSDCAGTESPKHKQVKERETELRFPRDILQFPSSQVPAWPGDSTPGDFLHIVSL